MGACAAVCSNGKKYYQQGFQQYAVKSWCVEAVNFWYTSLCVVSVSDTVFSSGRNAVQVFKQAVSGDLSRSEKVAKATAVFKSYISDDAELQVRILFFIFFFS